VPEEVISFVIDSCLASLAGLLAQYQIDTNFPLLESVFNHVQGTEARLEVAKVLEEWFYQGKSLCQMKDSIFSQMHRWTQCDGDREFREFDTYLGL
jgi:hypothetical protein